MGDRREKYVPYFLYKFLVLLKICDISTNCNNLLSIVDHWSLHLYVSLGIFGFEYFILFFLIFNVIILYNVLP